MRNLSYAIVQINGDSPVPDAIVDSEDGRIIAQLQLSGDADLLLSVLKKKYEGSRTRKRTGGDAKFYLYYYQIASMSFVRR